MSSTRPSLTSNLARLFWGVVAALLLLALLATVFLGRGSTDDAEAEAETRAADWANTVLFDVLAPEQVEEPILGPDYRELLITVQAGILSDDRAVRVRIWSADSLLVFSTDQRDKIDEFIASDNPQIDTALGGQTVSVPTQATVAPRSGLAGTDEKLFQTFVPLRVENQLGVSGVVQVDQRYTAIEADAAEIWQTARLALVIALTIAVAAFLFTLRARPVPVAVPAEPVPAEALPVPVPSRQERRALERAARTEDEIRALRARVEQAEAALATAESTANEAIASVRELQERAARAEERAANAELALQEAARAMTGGEAPRRGVPGVGAVTTAPPDGELAAKVQDLEQDRDELTGEVGRLRAALAEREAELALAREAATGDGELEEVRGLAARYEAQAADLEEQLAAMSTRAKDADERIADLQERLREAETVAGERAEGAAKDLEAAHARTAKELEAARAELAKADAEIAAAREELAARVGDADVTRAAEERASAVEARLGEMEGLIADVGERATQAERELERANERAAAADAKLAELETARAELAKELETARATSVGELETARAESAAELERVRAEAAEELERVRAEATAAAGLAGEGGDVEELRSQVAVLEEARRNDIAELQRAQEALANTQFEATAERRRAKELEDRLAEMEAQPPAPEYVPQLEVETSFASRFAHLMREHETPAAEPSAEPESPAEEVEVLSLRERLARAAAARHRPPGTPDPDS